MAEGKRITGLTAKTPLADAARRVLAVRLAVVHEALPLALRQWREDPEHVHQLRVGTRRAGAAVAIFKDFLPNKVGKALKAYLRKLRRAAGEARDWDVMGDGLLQRQQHAPARQRSGLHFLAGYAHGQRVAAQANLEAASAGAPFDFEELAAQSLAAVEAPPFKPPRRVLDDLARPWLGDMLAKFGELAAGPLAEYDQLHRVRIVGKRVRYGMEVFAPCFPSKFEDEYYPMVEEMQEILGQANDSHVAHLRLEPLRDLLKASRPTQWKQFQPGIDGFLTYHKRHVTTQKRLFHKWRLNWVKSGAEADLAGIIQPSP
jgi:CHAD domain-containing protein